MSVPAGIEPVCDLAACRTCTGCAHSRHEACRGRVRCPDTGDVRSCGCCGGASYTGQVSR